MSQMPDAVARALWDAAELPIVVSSTRGIVFVNRGFTALTGLRAEDVFGQPLTALARSASDAGGPREGRGAHGAIRVLTAATGAPIEVEQTVYTIDVDGERFAVSMFTCIDGRERGQATALAASERRNRALFDDGTTGRFTATRDWRLLECNATLARMLGASAGLDLVGRSLLDFAVHDVVLRKLAATALAERRAGPVELQLKPEAGGTIDVQCWIAASGSGLSEVSASIHGQVLEITDAREHERRLGGAHRMEVIGRLAGGIAHDFNNLLMVVSGNSERLLDDLPESSPLRPAASAIHEAAARATTLTRQLLAYGRRQVFALEPLTLKTAAQQVAPLLAGLLGDAVRLELDLEADAPPVSADSSQIEHILTTLARNARDAMPAGGTLRLSVDTIDIDDDGRRDRPWVRPGLYVRLVVADTGCGMDGVTRAHAFQPFFTTKPMGDGRGLGLASVYGIVKQSRGFIWVESEPEQGARFTLLFPVLAGIGKEAEEGTRAPETVLIVDADPTSLAAAAEALARRGYRVLEASSPAEAIDLLTSYSERVHLLVADAAAVTADGVPLPARVKAIDPMLQSLAIVSGRLDHAGRGVLPTTPTIQRPFTLHALAAKVRAVLDSGEGR